MSVVGGALKLGDKQTELIFRNTPFYIFDERKYSKSIVSMEKKDTNDKFFLLKLRPEEYCYAEYYYPENKPYRVYFHCVCNRWFIYKTYQRVDDLYTVDNFNGKVYYMGVIPDEIMNRGDFHEINDFISTVSVLHGENQRKLELQHMTGGAFRPNFRTMKSRIAPQTFLASYAREQKCGPSLIKLLINRHIADLQAYQQLKLQKIESSLGQNDLTDKIVTFMKNHELWVEARRNMSDYTALQDKVRRAVPIKRSSATRLVSLRGITLSDICNELIDYPSWTGFHYYFMRVTNKNGLQIIYDDINYAVQEGKKLRHLRVRPTEYAHKPQATTVFGATKVYSKGQIALDHWPLSNRPPSVSSISGYSTLSRMSTATTTPNSWQNDWKMQARHDEYDHRLTETTIPNVRDTRTRAQEQFAVRFNKELNSRIDFALADLETVMSTTLQNPRLDPRIIAECDQENIPTVLDRYGDMTWLKKAEHRISEILHKSNATTEDKKDLQVLYYAKQRYEQLLSRYDEIPSKKFFEAVDETQMSGLQNLSSGILNNSSRIVQSHLYINDSWRRLIESNRLPKSVLHVLKLLVTDRDAWQLDSDFSNLALVDRADRVAPSRVIQFFHDFHLPDNGTKFVAITTIVIVVLLLLFLSILLAKTHVGVDTSYCPSSAFGFNPNNPYQANWVRESLKIKSATNYEDSQAEDQHFFMLPE